MSTQSDLAELYTASFNRAPDAGGLAYWVDRIDTGQITLYQVAGNWLTEQPEGLTNFPSTLSDAQFIDKIYNNVLGRVADAGGAQYWLDQLQSGTVPRESFMLSIINGAKANTSAQGLLDSALISNKATAGVAFADRGLNDISLAAKVLSTVTANDDTLAATQAVIALLPNTAAAQTPAILSAANDLLTKFAALTAAAPGEVSDAATYLKTLVADVSAATNLPLLLSFADALLTSAASNPAALDNPASHGAADVILATPGTGGGVVNPPTATFDVVDTNGVLTFTGTATGAITIDVTSNTAIFTRGGIDAPTKILTPGTLIDLPDDSITLSASTAVQLSTNGVKFASNDDITLTDTGTALAALTFANFNSSVFGGDNLALDASGNTVSLTQVQADALIDSGLKFTAPDVVTVADSGAVLAGLDFSKYNTGGLGGLSVALDATDDAVTLTSSQADFLKTTPLKFSADDAVTIEVATADETTALTLYTQASIGGNKVTLDAQDDSWTVTATDLSTASQAGVLLAELDVVSIVNTLAQGVQTVSSFQSGSDKLQFSVGDIASSATYVGANGVDFGNGTSAELVVATGGGLVATGAHAAFLFNTATGTLSYDADGTGTSFSPTAIVTLTGATTLTANDFSFVA